MSNSNNDFFANLFASCCGERNPKKPPIVKGESSKKQREASFLEIPRASASDPSKKDFLNKCSGVFRSILSPIPSVGSSLESPSELLSSNLLEFGSESRVSPPPPLSRSPSLTPRLTSPPLFRSPSPKPRKPLISKWSDLSCFEMLPLQ